MLKSDVTLRMGRGHGAVFYVASRKTVGNLTTSQLISN